MIDLQNRGICPTLDEIGTYIRNPLFEAIYPRESFFTVLVVVGKKEKELVETILPDCTGELQEIYDRTKEGNGQKWLMIDLEDQGDLFQDVLRLIEIRRNAK